MRFGWRKTASLVSALTIGAGMAAIPPAVAAGVSFSAPTFYPAGAAASGPSDVAVADLNGNGHVDLVVAQFQTDELSVLLGDGTGRFSATGNFPTGDGPAEIALADFNEDGRADVLVGHFAEDDTVSVHFGDGRGRFSSPTTLAVGTVPSSVAAGDLNGDGHADLVVVNVSPSGSVTVLLGDGAGRFSTAGPPVPTGGGSNTTVLSDFNGDGHLDVATAEGDDDSVTVLLGDGTGRLPITAHFPAGPQPAYLAVGDFNSDAHPDLAVADLSGDVAAVLLGDGTGRFGAPALHPVGDGPVSVAVEDFDRDGHQDLAVGTRNRRPRLPSVSLLLGDGAGNFASAIDVDVTPPPGVLFRDVFSPEAVATGDFNGDGQRDLAYVGTIGGVVVLLNTTFKPSLTITPPSGPQGTTVTVRGSGYTPGSSIPVVKYVVPATFGRKGFYRPICSALVANDGSFQCRGQIPASTAAGSRGAHPIVAKDSTGLKAATTFTLT